MLGLVLDTKPVALNKVNSVLNYYPFNQCCSLVSLNSKSLRFRLLARLIIAWSIRSVSDGVDVDTSLLGWFIVVAGV